jgi:hypothetical protein
MAEARDKDKVVKAEFEYHHNRTGKTRYEVRVAKAKADEAATDKRDAMAADREGPGEKEAKAAETSAKSDEKATKADTKP